ncbi:PREDICTED: subtilisin-like protease SBT1.9 [Nicotiana attenuata]|uniref:Subtilisin-like protease sbt1.9 n=1 Tax=Nicotiana attenuata TaxID=49451 RepID=A0A1J6JKJ9_NICAT|nr:PREDICTED: subtilisin-like protease SBT1.9 [Nicotiana attenuata]OIT07457.1 subtilisin-like protease sbt1.9 [Nicotiana attenuata]
MAQTSKVFFSFANHHHWHSSTIDSIKIATPASLNSRHPVPKLLYSYDNVFHGFSAVLSKDELEALKKSKGFISAYKDRSLEAHTTHTSEFLKLNPSSGLWPASGFGQDVIIGVLDSGVWPESASFRDDGMPEIPKKWKGICRPGVEFNTSMCNRKLIGANYFNKGLMAENPDWNISMNSARDTVGHGTHVASIAAGNFVKGASYFGYAPGTAKGVAPRARLAVYKFSFDEGNVASDLIAAMDQAVADGVDMICISYGWRFIPLYEDTIAIAAFGAMIKGVLVSASAGNSGPNMGSLNNGVPWIFTVASGHTDRWFSGTLTLGNGLTIRGWSLFPARAIISNWPVIYNKTLSACDSAELLAQVPDAGRSIIVCQRSGDAEVVTDQMNYVAEARVGAAILITEDPAILRSTEFPNPGVVITPKEGKQVMNYVTKTPEPKASISFLETYLDSKPAPVVSASSARGPSRSYLGVAKPDILAPGVLILAAYPSNIAVEKIGTNVELATDYYLESGTSMAAPHIAGIAAMVKGAHPEWSPSAIRSAMMTTANPLDNTQKPIKSSEDNKRATPLDMGAGHVDPNRALDPGLIYDATPQDYVNLLCSLNFTEEQFKTIARSSANHNCSNTSSDINYPSFIAFFSPQGDLTWLEQKFRRTVTNVGSGAAKYRVKVKSPRNSNVSVSPQTLVFKKKNQKQSYTLTIRYKDNAEQIVESGSISWVEEKGNHRVRSPIVISPEIEVW